MTDAVKIADAGHALARKGFHHDFGTSSVRPERDPEWQKLRAVKTRLWLDTGDIDEAERLWKREFEALTTNNTLLNREVQKGIYDNLVGEAAAAIRKVDAAVDDQLLVREIAFVLNARHGLRLVQKFDAHVSVELHTDLGNDVAQTLEYGKRYFEICPERFYVKVPFTPAGLLAARKLELAGVPVNFTLGFSARQNYATAVLANTSYVNMFMGRLNAFVADHRLGNGRNVGEKATLSAQREIRALRAAGRSKSLLIGASMRDGHQVHTLAGLDVYTMPPKVAVQYRKAPAAEITPQWENDPKVTTARRVHLVDFNGPSLWDVPDTFKACVDDLATKDLDRITVEDVHAHFEAAGLEDFLPRWSAHDIDIVTADGKIPAHETWHDKLADGTIGLDALMNISAFCSFASDQKSLDDRIRSLL